MKTLWPTKLRSVCCGLLLIASCSKLCSDSVTHTSWASTPTTIRRRSAPSERGLVAQARSITGDSFGFSTTTPRGTRILAHTKPQTQVLRTIDDGLTQLFAIARRHGYRARLNHSDYTIFIGRADRTKDSNGAYSPDIRIGAAQYAGSIYDQGGYVYAAGLVLAYNPCAFVIAEHTRDLQRIANVVRYEGEHLVLYHNDRARYQATADHSRGGGHPILQ